MKSNIAAFFAQNKLKTLVAIASLAIGLTIVFGTGANFTAQTANPSNVFTAGSLSMTNSKNNAAIFTTNPNLKPGDSNTGTVTITNSGNIAGNFSLDKGTVSDTPGPNGGNLSSVLQIKVEDVTVAASPVTVVATTNLSSFTTVALDGDTSTSGVQPFAAGDSRTYKFTVTFPDGGTPGTLTTGDNAFKGSATTAQFLFNATS